MSTPNARFGDYVLEYRLGQGGMAETWAALEPLAGGTATRRVALKMILPEHAEDENFREMFFDEVRISSLIDHPNVARVHRAGDIDGTLFMALDWIDGWSLDGVVASYEKVGQPMPAAHVLAVGAEVLAGLQAAHELVDVRGSALHVVHRDVSPQNVMIARAGDVKLIDFGIAKGRGNLVQTRTGLVKGKVIYMSPEQLEAKPIDPRSDLFALGLVLYELLTGVHPLRGSTEAATIYNYISREIPLPSTHRAELRPAVDAVIMRALERSVHARWQSARAMLDALLDAIAAQAPGYRVPRHTTTWIVDEVKPLVDDGSLVTAVVSGDSDSDPFAQTGAAGWDEGTASSPARRRTTGMAPTEPVLTPASSTPALQVPTHDPSGGRPSQPAVVPSSPDLAIAADPAVAPDASRASVPAQPASDSGGPDADTDESSDAGRSLAIWIVAAVVLVAGALVAWLVLDSKSSTTPTEDEPAATTVADPTPATPASPTPDASAAVAGALDASSGASPPPAGTEPSSPLDPAAAASLVAHGRRAAAMLSSTAAAGVARMFANHREAVLRAQRSTVKSYSECLSRTLTSAGHYATFYEATQKLSVTRSCDLGQDPPASTLELPAHGKACRDLIEPAGGLAAALPSDVLRQRAVRLRTRYAELRAMLEMREDVWANGTCTGVSDFEAELIGGLVAWCEEGLALTEDTLELMAREQAGWIAILEAEDGDPVEIAARRFTRAYTFLLFAHQTRHAGIDEAKVSKALPGLIETFGAFETACKGAKSTRAEQVCGTFEASLVARPSLGRAVADTERWLQATDEPFPTTTIFELWSFGPAIRKMSPFFDPPLPLVTLQ